MFNTHTPQMTELLRKLPQMYQDNVGEILEKNGADSPLKMTGPSPMKPRSLQPPHTGGRTRITSPLKPIHPDESENMNPDEVNKSLRLTANAIQNYSFDRTDKMRIDMMPDEKDSGISQVYDGGLNIEEKLAALELERLEGRVSNGRSGIIRPPAAMDDMLYGSNDSTSRAYAFRSLPRNLAMGVVMGVTRPVRERNVHKPRPLRKAIAMGVAYGKGGETSPTGQSVQTNQTLFYSIKLNYPSFVHLN
ncbi:CLIP-associating protein 2 isoform X2 [Eurytemora carolleeae]|uniref:CLIP-associating protein 2 isoform X2 n=1 Tax=Eurytemora carolleeae TaxID=1294199 RepID=UPI000C761310|nr:CLIP-associating protein 2 isoform X2 [Eurytemora carolleeae]|eukprot:XP_023332730.1 CLIP-associating protein 2-like isoform X2 [Eurytemora affinis]